MRYSRKPRRAADKWTLSCTDVKLYQSYLNLKEAHLKAMLVEAMAAEVAVATAAEAVVATAAEAAVVAMAVEAVVAATAAEAAVVVATAAEAAVAAATVEVDHTKEERKRRSITHRYE